MTNSSKQDGTAPRTAADLERKYNFGKSFADVYNLATDAQKVAEEAKSAMDNLTQDQIFNILTNYGEWQGIYRDDAGGVYINASFIKSGELKGENLTVDAATITGKLIATQVDIKDLEVNAAKVVGKLEAAEIDAGQITGGKLDFSVVEAEHLSASYISGGTLNFKDINVKNLSASDISAGDLRSVNIYGAYIESGELYTEGEDLSGDPLALSYVGISGGYINMSGKAFIFSTSDDLYHNLEGEESRFIISFGRYKHYIFLSDQIIYANTKNGTETVVWSA